MIQFFNFYVEDLIIIYYLFRIIIILFQQKKNKDNTETSYWHTCHVFTLKAVVDCDFSFLTSVSV